MAYFFKKAKVFLIFFLSLQSEIYLYKNKNIMKVGIIRCMQTEDYCPGTADFLAIRAKRGSFAELDGELELVGFTNCGGCPGKRVLLKTKLLIDRGAEVIAFASCIKKGTPMGYPCPFHEKMIQMVRQKFGEQVKILEYSH